MIMEKKDATLGGVNRQGQPGQTMKVIVFTSTGDQGRSVCEKLVTDGAFEVWGVTRDVNGKGAKALAAKGVKMVRADLDDPASYKPHLEGMDGAYVNADFFSTYFANGQDSPTAQATEVRQTKVVIDACKAAGVGHVVFSALDEYEKEEWKVPHFESKAETARYIKEIYNGHVDRPNAIHHDLIYTNIYTCTYFSDMLKFGMLNPDPESKNKDEWILGLPVPDDTKVAGFAVEQLGEWVKKAFLDHKSWAGKDMQICSEYITPTNMAEIISKTMGMKVRTLGMTREAFSSQKHRKNLGDPLWLTYNAYVDGFFKRDIDESKKVYPDQWDFEGWASQSKELKAVFNQA